MEKDIGMACQKVKKQDRDDIKVKANIQSPIPISFLHYGFLVYKRCRDRRGFVYLPSLLYHPHLISVLFGCHPYILFHF